MKTLPGLLVGLFLCGGYVGRPTYPCYGAGAPSESLGTSAPTTGDKQIVIVVVGAAGTPEYAAQFITCAKQWEQACARSDARFLLISVEEPEAGTARPHPSAADSPASDRTRIREILAGQSAPSTAPLWLVLIGHGTFDGRTPKFNLRGPDLSARDLAEWLQPLQRPLAVLNTASASAPFLTELSAPGRIIITATQSGFEQNYARFGTYLAETIIDPRADLDKDGQTSLLEAFLSAAHAVEQFYASAGRLATEHALLDDNGDGLGTLANWFRGLRPVQRARDDAALDGYRAHQLHLLYSPGERTLTPELRVRRDQLELQLLELRDNKAKFSDEEYFSRLESVLREIAHIYERTNKSSPPRAPCNDGEPRDKHLVNNSWSRATGFAIMESHVENDQWTLRDVGFCSDPLSDAGGTTIRR